MISLPAGSRIWLVAGITDMRNGFNGLASKVQNVLKDDPFSGHLFIFRGRRGDQIKVLWADSDGLCLFTKRLERGRFSVMKRGFVVSVLRGTGVFPVLCLNVVTKSAPVGARRLRWEVHICLSTGQAVNRFSF